MKKLLLLFSVLLCGLQQAVADDAGSMLMGYCGETPFSGMVLGGARQESIVCVKFDEEFTTQFAGCKVLGVRAMISGQPGGTAGVWLTDELPTKVPNMTDPSDPRTDDYYKAAQKKPEEFAYHFPYESWLDMSKGADLAWAWMEGAFKEGYTIEAGKPFYAGFRTFPPVGAMSNAVIATENGGTDVHSFVYFNNSEDPWCPLAQTSMAEYGVNLMIQVRISGESLPKNNIAMANIKGADFQPADEPTSFQCVIQNKGANTLKSFEMSYFIDNVLQGSRTMNFQNGLEYGQFGGFTLDDIVFTKSGSHTLRVVLSKPNGVDDTDPSDNERSFGITVYRDEESVERHVLVETFTGLTCGNCPAAHEREEEAFEGLDPIWVTHHAGYYDDELTVPISKEMTWFYNEGGGTYAPGIMFDRTVINNYIETGKPGPVFVPAAPNELRTVYENLTKVPTSVGIALEATYDEASRQLVVTAKGDVMGDPGVKDPRINVWLTESGIKVRTAQSGSTLGRDYVHNHTMRGSLTPTWGDKVSLADGSFSRTYTYNLDAKWVPANMEVVAFIANIDGSDATNCRVLNAAKLPIKSLMPEGISTLSAGQTQQGGIVYDMQGRTIREAERGVYITGGKKILK